ncbi:hypothetical protein HC931_07625 [Candidatus Gracilibacteria bacterium]|nr:hypothetical protein [Candidatus Gracilibacteria bacterium]
MTAMKYKSIKPNNSVDEAGATAEITLAAAEIHTATAERNRFGQFVPLARLGWMCGFLGAKKRSRCKNCC